VKGWREGGSGWEDGKGPKGAQREGRRGRASGGGRATVESLDVEEEGGKGGRKGGKDGGRVDEGLFLVEGRVERGQDYLHGLSLLGREGGREGGRKGVRRCCWLGRVRMERGWVSKMWSRGRKAPFERSSWAGKVMDVEGHTTGIFGGIS